MCTANFAPLPACQVEGIEELGYDLVCPLTLVLGVLLLPNVAADTILLGQSTNTEHMAFMGDVGDVIEFRKRSTFQPYYTGGWCLSFG